MKRFYLKYVIILLLAYFSSTTVYSQNSKWVVVKLKDGQVNSYLLKDVVRITAEQDSLILRSNDIKASYLKSSVSRYFVIKENELEDDIHAVIQEGITVEHVGRDVLKITGLPVDSQISVYGSNGMLFKQFTVGSNTALITLESLPSGVYILHSASIGSIKVVKK